MFSFGFLEVSSLWVFEVSSFVFYGRENVLLGVLIF